MILIEALLSVLALLALYLALKCLIRKSRIAWWIRSTFGLAFAAVAILIGLVLMDLLGYEKLLKDKPLANLTSWQNGPQRFTVSIEYLQDGSRSEFDLQGDLWQIDAKIIRWFGIFQAMGAKPAYRLDRISGRYFSVEEERWNQRTVYPLKENSGAIDVWSLLQKHADFFPWADAVYGSATFLPLKNGAIYQISLSNSGLAARPANDIARKAVAEW